MKKLIIPFAFAAAILAACTTDIEESIIESGTQITITATNVAPDATRTMVQDGGTQVLWEPADEIAIFHNGSGSRFVSQNAEPAATASFSGTLNTILGSNEGVSEENPIWGLYPYREDASSDKVSVTTALPSEQVGRAGTFAKNTQITLAKATGLSLGFYNVAGGLRFSLTQEGIKSVTFEGKNGEKLAGTIKLAFEDGVPVVQEVTNGATVITLTAPNGEAFQTGQWYYLAAIPCTLANGFKMTFNKDAEYAELISDKSVTFKRGIFGSITSADNGLVFKEDHEKQLALERQALIAIYNALDGEHWEYNKNWCSDKPLQMWDNVETSYGHVISLFRQHWNCLKGQIPAEIGDLKHLNSLLLVFDVIDNPSCFPKEMKNLKNLIDLDIFCFQDPASENRIDFPDWICELTNLQSLHLSSCGFKGQIPSQISQLDKLKNLEIYRSFLSGSLPTEIGNLMDLENLSIANLGDMGEIPSSIGNLTNLTRLNLSEFSGAIPKEIGRLTKLKELHLYSPYPVTSVPEEIFNLNKLTWLALNFVQYPMTIPESIGNLTELEVFESDYNKAGVLPESLGKLRKLKYMSISNPLLDLNLETLNGNIPKSVMELEYWPYFWADILFGHPFLNTDNLNIPAPQIHAVDINENPINTDEIYNKNKLTILYHGGEICPAVSQLVNLLKPLYNKYSSKGLDIIGYDSIDNSQIAENANELGLAWKLFSSSLYPFANGSSGCPGNIMGLAIVVDSSGQVVYDSVTGNYVGLQSYVENVFGEHNNDTQYNSSDYTKDGNVVQLQTAKDGNGINLVLMGDAFSDREIESGVYDAVMRNTMEAFFSEEPYHSMRDLFSVSYIVVVSKNEGYYESGVTALSGFFGEGTHVGGSDTKAIKYALNAVPIEDMNNAVIIVTMNRDAYAGTCYMYFSNSGDSGCGTAIAYFPTSSNTDVFGGLVSHEAGGHGFAKLGDEYAYESYGTITEEEINDVKTKEPYGWWKNVDFTSDPAQVKWSHFLSDERYANEGLGCFEGGLTYWSGVWRPTENSIMRYNTGGFNAPSRYAIWYRIGKLAYGENWEGSYEDFVAYDAINRTPAAQARRKAQARHNCVEKDLPPLAPPVVINHSWREELQKGK